MGKFRLWGYGVLIILLPLLCCRQFSGSGALVILHTNDMHSQFQSMPATWVDTEPKPMVGGMVALKYFVDREKSRHPNTLVLDAGDIMTGSPISNINVNGARGGGYVKMVNLIGYHAMTIGNHEFDNGLNNLRKLLNLLKCDVICANVTASGQLLAPRPYKIYRIGNLRVGVIGLMTEELFRVTAITNLTGIQLKDPVTTAQKYIDKLDPKTDLIILLTHQGVEQDSILAETIHNADIIVGGHGHSILQQPRVVNRVLILQAGSRARNLGRLAVTVTADTISAFEGALIPLWVDSVNTRNPEMVTMVNYYNDQIDKIYGARIGELTIPLAQSRHGESPAGNWLTDMMRTATGADFAMLNSGGIRKSLAPGPITKLDIVEMLPFYNQVVEFSCTGKELLSIIQTNATSAVKSGHGILQVSGLHYGFKTGPGGDAIIAYANINGQEIVPDQQYRGATVDFVMSQAQSYFGFIPQGDISMSAVISDLVIDYLKAKPRVDQVSMDRMKKLD